MRRRRLIALGFILVALTGAVACSAIRECNNFHTFRWSFWNLIGGLDLYVLHPSQHEDLYKYSPTFALLFAPLAALPFGPALAAWNLLNALALYVAADRLLPERRHDGALLLLLVGHALTYDGTQSNALVAGLMMLSFLALERNRPVAAAVSVAGGALVKLFPVASAVLGVMYARRTRFAGALLAAGLLLGILPALVTGLDGLVALYRSWYLLEEVDALDRGASVMSLLAFAGYRGSNLPVQMAGTLLLLAPLAGRMPWTDPAFRYRMLALVLVYSVVFNHKAEQPTFVIAFAGLAIWYAISDRKLLQRVLAGAATVAMIPVCASAIAGQWDHAIAAMTLPALRLAAVPFLLVWATILVELLRPARPQASLP